MIDKLFSFRIMNLLDYKLFEKESTNLGFKWIDGKEVSEYKAWDEFGTRNLVMRINFLNKTLRYSSLDKTNVAFYEKGILERIFKNPNNFKILKYRLFDNKDYEKNILFKHLSFLGYKEHPLNSNYLNIISDETDYVSILLDIEKRYFYFSKYKAYSFIRDSLPQCDYTSDMSKFIPPLSFDSYFSSNYVGFPSSNKLNEKLIF